MKNQRGEDSMNNRRVLWGVILLVAAVLLTPGYFIARTYGLFQHEVVLTKYQLAVDVDGEQVDAWPLLAGFAATDKKGSCARCITDWKGRTLTCCINWHMGSSRWRLRRTIRSWREGPV